MKLTQLLFLFVVLFLYNYAKDTYTVANSIAFARQQLHYATINHVFFCPDDDIKTLLLGLINAEKRSIKAALFQLTEESIVTALINAQKRGVKVEIVMDNRGSQEKNCKIELLRQHKIPVYIHKNKMYAIMHNKFWIFSSTIFGKSLAWSGSANATIGGTTRNEENVFITQSSHIIARYEEKFVNLKSNSVKKAHKEQDEIVTSNLASLLQFLLSWFSGYSSF